MIRTSIARPVTIAMAYLVIAALGVFAWRNIPVELLPDTQLPRLTVSAGWNGASAEVVEAFLTSPLEAVVQQVQGVETVTSTSTAGSANIGVTFNIDTDMDFARLELSERLGALEGQLSACLPQCRPRVSPYTPREFQDARQPLISYTAAGPYTLEVLREYLIEDVQEALLQVDGVDRIDINGGRDKILEVQLDEAKIQALGLQPRTVGQAIQQLEMVQQAGAVIGDDGLIRPIAIREKVESLEDILDARLAVPDGRLLRVRDVGRVYESLADASSYARINAMPAVTLSIYKAPRVNAVETADAVKAKIASLGPSLPTGMSMVMNENSDQSTEIRKQLTDLRTRALFSAITVLLVLLLFLRSIRAATIVFATVAFAVLITINLIYFGGLTLNVLTLMGLAMGFGLVVDNAIVVLENTYRLRRRGFSSREAAERGAKEVVLPILAATGTTVVVVIPFVYLQGELRIFYVPLAVVVGISLVASLFVAFTFIPALGARLLTTIGTGKALAWKEEGAEAGNVEARSSDRAETRSRDHAVPRSRGEQAAEAGSAAGAAGSMGPAGPRLGATGDSPVAERKPRFAWFRRKLAAAQARVEAVAGAADPIEALKATPAKVEAVGSDQIAPAGARPDAAEGTRAAGAKRPGRLRRLFTLPVGIRRVPRRALALVPAFLVWLRSRKVEVPIPELAGQPWYVRIYATMIGFSLRHAWITVFLAIGALGGSYYLFDRYVTRNSRFGGFGSEPRTQISISIRPPRGESIEEVDALARYFEDRLIDMPEISEFRTGVYATNGSIVIDFPDSLQYSMIPLAIEEELIQYSLTFGGTDIRVRGMGPAFMYGSSGGVSSPNYSIQVLGYNYEKVREIAEDLGRRFAVLTRVRDVDTNSSGRYTSVLDRQTEIAVDVDRESLANYNLTARDVQEFVGSAIRSQVGGATVRIAGEEMQLQVKLSGFQTMDVQRLQQTLLPARTGEAVRIEDVVDIYERRVMSNIARENQQYNRYVSYEFRGPPKLGDTYRDSIIAATVLPPGYTIKGSRDYSFPDEDKEQIYHVMAIAVVLIFMVTAALFESLKLPLCVLLTVPMALIGVFLLFFFIEASFTPEAYIGTIMMSGIVVNNAILLVDHVNQLRWHHGLDRTHALVRGTIERVRPIMMTSLTTICGLLPLVLFSETVNSNIWNALGYTLIGGLASSTILVLTVTPALYLLLEHNKLLVGSMIGAIAGLLVGITFFIDIILISTVAGLVAGGLLTIAGNLMMGGEVTEGRVATA